MWVLAVGLFNMNTISNPYVSETLFTFSKDNALEVVPMFSEQWTKIRADEQAGSYTRVGFADDAPRVFYMAPNAFKVTVRGKTFELLLSNERMNNPDYDALARSLTEFIGANELNLDPAITLEEARAAIPANLVRQYQEPWVAYQTSEFAIQTQARLTEEARRGAILATASGMFIPPLVLLILGAAIGWVVTGFRRKPQTT